MRRVRAVCPLDPESRAKMTLLAPNRRPAGPMKGVMFCRLVMSPGALAALDQARMHEIMTRHLNGDWGVVGPTNAAANDQAADGGRILSAYPIDPAKPCDGCNANTVWILTEADRRVTTILLPEEC